MAAECFGQKFACVRPCQNTPPLTLAIEQQQRDVLHPVFVCQGPTFGFPYVGNHVLQFTVIEVRQSVSDLGLQGTAMRTFRIVYLNDGWRSVADHCQISFARRRADLTNKKPTEAAANRCNQSNIVQGGNEIPPLTIFRSDIS
jgi:hypothetical protein